VLKLAPEGVLFYLAVGDAALPALALAILARAFGGILLTRARRGDIIDEHSKDSRSTTCTSRWIPHRAPGRSLLRRVGNSSQAFHKVEYHVEPKVRRFAAKQRKRTGFAWKPWSSAIVYGTWGRFRDYRLA